MHKRAEKASRHNADWRSRQILALLEGLMASSRYIDRLLIRLNGRSIFVKALEVDWIEAQGNYVRVHSQQNQHLLRRRIGDLERSLDPRVFLRVNRSTIVNIDRVRELQPLSHGDVRLVLEDGTQLTVSRNYRKSLGRLLGE